MHGRENKITVSFFFYRGKTISSSQLSYEQKPTVALANIAVKYKQHAITVLAIYFHTLVTIIVQMYCTGKCKSVQNQLF
jgi:hypothetical protein